MRKRNESARKVRFAIVGVIVVASLVGGAYALGATAATNRAIDAIVDAGVMTKFANGFRPNDPATRGDVALALHRSIPRIAVQTSLGDMNIADDSVNIGNVTLKVDGAAGKDQGVLVSVQMQLDHDTAVASGCFPSWELTKGASATVLATWSQEIYSGPANGEEDNIAFTMFVTQPTNTKGVYHLLGSNPCDQTLYTDEDIMTAQSFPLNGQGKAQVAAAIFAQHSALRRHDQ
jgi:hypothetical protein